MKKVNLTCIECPIGCDLSVEVDGNTVLSVKGNTCPRGEKYAFSEITSPRRVLTTTVKTNVGKMLPVKSKEPICKQSLFLAVKELSHVVVKAPIKIGDVISNFDGVEIVACMDLE